MHPEIEVGIEGFEICFLCIQMLAQYKTATVRGEDCTIPYNFGDEDENFPTLSNDTLLLDKESALIHDFDKFHQVIFCHFLEGQRSAHQLVC